MFNFSNKKTKKIVSSVIIILLVLAMIIPTLAGAFSAIG
ncbi:synaptobrevin-B [Clostridium sp. chh4-2]